MPRTECRLLLSGSSLKVFLITISCCSTPLIFQAKELRIYRSMISYYQEGLLLPHSRNKIPQTPVLFHFQDISMNLLILFCSRPTPAAVEIHNIIIIYFPGSHENAGRFVLIKVLVVIIAR